MNSVQLGKKLKEARLNKKLTQSDVVGTFITRNMLSQIESGAASPSLRTLEYLANTLEIPIHYLISQEQIESCANKTDVLIRGESEQSTKTVPVLFSMQEAGMLPSTALFLKCKAAYLDGDFDFVTENAEILDNKDSLYYDEAVALLARAYLKKAALFMKNKQQRLAIANARQAAKYGEIGIYSSREIRTEALLMTVDDS
jgi:transcriptional regulator with XRE-family HTH domain